MKAFRAYFNLLEDSEASSCAGATADLDGYAGVLAKLRGDFIGFFDQAQHILDVKQHNTRLPVNHLPDDALASIFIFASCGPIGSRPQLVMVDIARTCQRWRK